MKQKTVLNIGGGVTLLFGIFHVFFYWIFDWSRTLVSLNPIDWGIMLTFSVVCTWVILSMAYLMLFRKDDLLRTKLGRSLLKSYAIFWVVRIIAEFVFFVPDAVSSPVIVILCLAAALTCLLPAIKGDYRASELPPSTKID